MKSFLSTTLMVNNYSHDIATAALFVSGIMMWVLTLRFPLAENDGINHYFIRVYKSITRLAKYSLIWVLAAGVPRIIFYREFEWSSKAGDLQVIAIAIKHVVMFSLVGTGIFLWLKLNRKVKKLYDL